MQAAHLARGMGAGLGDAILNRYELWRGELLALKDFEQVRKDRQLNGWRVGVCEHEADSFHKWVGECGFDYARRA